MKDFRMANETFQFKQFLVRQDRSAFKVGTDGVLLGAWVNCRDAKRALDIGTGTGLLALMLAQRSNAEITAIELDRSSCQQAQENFRSSPWSERLRARHLSLQEFHSMANEPFDFIISNPPFFSNAYLPKGSARRISRHTGRLSFSELLEGVIRLLSAAGIFALILPMDQCGAFCEMAAGKGLRLHRKMHLIPSPEKQAIRGMMEFRRQETATPEITRLVIEDRGRHQYSEAYRALTKDFYLNF